MSYSPFCTSYAALEVTGSTYPGVNGIYYPVASNISCPSPNEHDIWCKNDVNDLIRILKPSCNSWNITYRTGLGPQNAPLFFYSATSVCPPLGTWVVGAFGSGPAPTVAQYIPVINPIDARNNKYATATESGANRFRRLHALGYV